MIIKYEDILNDSYYMFLALNELKTRSEYSTTNIYKNRSCLELLELFIKTYKYETAFVNMFENIKFLGNDHDALWVNEPYRGEDKIPDFVRTDDNITVELKCYNGNINTIMYYNDSNKTKFHAADIIVIYSKADNAFYKLFKTDNYNKYTKCKGETFEELAKEFAEISQNNYINIV